MLSIYLGGREGGSQGPGSRGLAHLEEGPHGQHGHPAGPIALPTLITIAILVPIPVPWAILVVGLPPEQELREVRRGGGPQGEPGPAGGQQAQLAAVQGQPPQRIRGEAGVLEVSQDGVAQGGQLGTHLVP
eukprot:CAMPEP_0170084846 /NCGR_PEP_ID=MMETSP0019_2-20121128/19910_1 /TAXON_ID=98059 /ORGANISM="Dinobryon sp., Strain UTEXLB2267" /LENGTH=130 /DNA_ID=CAMNT_0010301077 /DNA_START=50 /DNA_END=442 /DNA_ORIENTATION=-